MTGTATFTASAIVSGPFATEFRREASESELCFDVDTLAKALTHVFQTATGEFSFAIFGAWGRGKTTLLRRLKHFLASSRTERFPTYVAYHFIDFSAWKYRTSPECWAHLYESFADAVSSLGFFARMLVTFRTNLIRHGIWRLAIAAILFALLVIPFQWRLDAFLHVLQAIGLLTVVYLVSLYLGTHRSDLVGAIKQLAMLRRHNEKLGLQAAIGSDLKTLVVGWLPQGAFPVGFRFWCGLLTYIFAMFFAVAEIAIRVQAAAQDITSNASRYLFLTGIGLLLLAWLLGSLAMAVHLIWLRSRSGRRAQRLLLCVDDLDRCELPVMLDVIESLKLILDDPQINQRLQIIFLLDRRILEHAISRKYHQLFTTSVGTNEGSNVNAPIPLISPLIRQNIDKYISAYIEMPPLERGQVWKLIEAYIGIARESRVPSQAHTITAGDVVWSEADQTAFSKVFGDVVATGTEYSARQTRHAILQYQIAKLLLRESGSALSPHDLQEIARGVLITIVENVQLDVNDFGEAVLMALRHTTTSSVANHPAVI